MKRVGKTKWKPLTKIGRLRVCLSLAWLFILLILLIAGGCTRTEVEEDVIPPHVLKDVEVGFNLNVLATRTPVTRSITFTPDGTIEADTLAVGVKDTLQTKAAGPLSEVQENQIASLWVGQYDAATGKRLFNEYLPSLTGTTVNLKLKQSQNGSKSRVYFVTNAGDLGAIADEATLKQHTLAYTSTDAGLPDNSLCQMTGMWEGVVYAGGIKDITVELTRLLAKITFTYSTGTGFTFTPTSVVLKNAPTVSQVEAPAAQLPGITYKTYTGTASQTGATIYWYLPENMAGTAIGDAAVGSEKEKVGKGVANATCIELSGDAVQGGLTYKDVTFRFYPGSNYNNYDIIRNSHYTMTVTLVGIDVSDERITVGEIPPIEVAPDLMPAKKGGEKAIQVITRPGQEWVFDMPGWLSALLDNKEIPAGATITHQGPANVVFKATEANPKAETRDISFDIDVNGTPQNITITQAGSTLQKGANVSLGATAGSEGSSTFTATEGLQWLAGLSGGDGWLDWAATNPAIRGDEAPASAQTLKVTSTTANPLAQVRSGKITVKAGASVGDATYTGLKQEITVTQAGSTVAGSSKTVDAAATDKLTSSFTATAGLNWAASVTNGSWITLGTTSGGPTTGAAENLTYNVAVNPSSSQRRGEITVRAGDVSAGPTGKITVTQPGAVLSVSGAKTIAAAASTNTSTFKATKGLSWNVSENIDWLTLSGTTTGTNNTTGANQTITYNAVLNPNPSTRYGNITVKAGNAVSGTDAGLTKTIKVTQSAASLIVKDATTLGAAKDATGSLKTNGTAGLRLTFTPPSWITLTSTLTQTNGNDQTVGYKASQTNPKNTNRTGNMTVKAGNITKTIAITQLASDLSLTISPATLAATSRTTTGTFRMVGTKGLSYSFTTRFPRWISVTNGTASTNGGTTTGGAQTLTYKTNSVNPSEAERSAVVTVKAGEMSKSVTIRQNASSLTVKNATTLGATKDAAGTFTTTGTAGLSLTFTPPTWVNLTSTPTQTNGGNQSVGYKAKSINLNSSQRTGTMTVKAGDITKTITIKQSASSFSASGGAQTIAGTGGSTTGKVNATAGLPWTISPVSSNGITVSPTRGTGNATLTFRGATNTGAARTGSFTVSVTGASPARNKTITVKQATGEIAYFGKLQVCKTDEADSNWSTANTNCNNSTKEGYSDWRLPSFAEAMDMYRNKSSLEAVNGFTSFKDEWYRTSTQTLTAYVICNLATGSSLSPGVGQESQNSKIYKVRCVRNK